MKESNTTCICKSWGKQGKTDDKRHEDSVKTPFQASNFHIRRADARGSPEILTFTLSRAEIILKSSRSSRICQTQAGRLPVRRSAWKVPRKNRRIHREIVTSTPKSSKP